MKRYLALIVAAASLVLAVAGIAWSQSDRPTPAPVAVCPRPASPVAPSVPCIN